MTVKKVGFIFEKGLDFLSLLWYVVVLTGGAIYEKYDKRTVARKHHSRGGQQKQLKGDEAAHGVMARLHEDLTKTLNDKQKEIFEKFDDCWSEYTSLAEAAIFEYAFRLGARLTMEVQSDINE